MISVSDEEFDTLYWPKLESAVNLILQQSPGEFIPISYEEMYRLVLQWKFDFNNPFSSQESW